MRRWMISWCVLTAVLSSGCGGPKAEGVDAAAAADAGAATTPDAGALTPDASAATPDAGAATPDAGAATPDTGAVTPDAGGTTPDASDGAPRAVTVARATAIPACTLHVDAASTGAADGSRARPYATIGAAVAVAPSGAIICVAEGVYREALAPAEKYLSLAGGFQRGFLLRDSARFVSKAQGSGVGSFFRVGDPGPTAGPTHRDRWF